MPLISGSASALNGVVFVNDVTGYTTAYVGTTVTGSGATTVTGVFEASIDSTDGSNGTWFPLPYQVVTGLTTPAEATASVYFVQSGGGADPQFYKVRTVGKWLRMRLDFYDGSGNTVTAVGDLSSTDSQDTFGLTKAVVTDYLGNSPTVGSANTANSLSVAIASDQIPVPTSLPYATRSDTFTTTSNGTTIDRSTSPLKEFSLQVVKTGSVTSWNVVLEGSLDGTNFDTLLTHTDVTPGNGKLVLIGASAAPILYFRSRCSALVLGPGTNVIATILGMN